ncbi:MAG: Prolyl oligopeptidase family protein [Nevskia sp.]|nr:Prolyl oligopeptidase family protein [Nevskia sp.]
MFSCEVLASEPSLAKSLVPLQDFARIDSYNSATLSPDGKFLALHVPVDGAMGLAVIDLASQKILSKISAGHGRSILDYVWAGPSRLVAGLADSDGSVDYPLPTGELIGIDADGKNPTYLFGPRGSAQIGWHLSEAKDTRGVATIIRSLPNDPEHIRIAVRMWGDSELHIVYRLNVLDGVLDQGLSAPTRGPTQFVADRDGFVRFAVVDRGVGHVSSYRRSPDKPDWVPLIDSNQPDAQIIPIALSSDARSIYLSDDELGDGSCLEKQDLQSGERTKLSCEPGADLERTLFEFDDEGSPVAATFELGKPKIDWLSSTNPTRTMLEDLQKAFPDQLALPVSTARHGDLVLIEVVSDRNPGDYYLLDAKTHKASYLTSRYDWIDPALMPERVPIEFNARDGQRLHGFLTMPRGRAARKQALVVMPHGGPFDVRDSWLWNANSAALASRGYSVLQVNFRGSGGFGRKFLMAGRRGWDHTMIDDITDGTRWAIAQDYADARRVCIFGTSYGGYAALMSAVREPDLYRCTIGFAGVYDLPRWRNDSDVGGQQSGLNYISQFIGADTKSLRKASPITYIDQLKAAVMIIHGEQDERVPFNQAEYLRDALDERSYPYTWLTRQGEGHGFMLPKNRLAVYEQMIQFLDHNIGTASQTEPSLASGVAGSMAPGSADGRASH